MRWFFACALLLLSCSGMDPARPPEAAPASFDPAQRAAIERDLVVLLTRTGSGEVDADASWPITPTLVNRGSGAHWVVRPDSGSGSGWREPNVYYTAEMEAEPGVWRPVPRRDDVRRCSMYASNWHADATEMAPGASMELEDFFEPWTLLEFPRSGTVRLYAHYDYDGGRKGSFRFGRHQPTELPKELEGIGPFAIVSAPLELQVHVDTSAEVTLVLRRREVRVGERVPLSALADVSIVSRSGTPIDLGDDYFGSPFRLDVDTDERGGAFPVGLDGPRTLAPRERVWLHPTAGERDIVSATPGTMRLRARYDSPLGFPNEERRLRRYRSPWVEVKVVP